jgi:hypothetical protein
MAISRCGAMRVIFGTAIMARPIIRLGYQEWFKASRIIDDGSYPPSPEEKEATHQENLDARSVLVFGPILGGLGTLLWDYGDLLGKALSAIGYGPSPCSGRGLR